MISQSRPVEYRFFLSREIPSRKIPWYLNPVRCNPVKSQSRPIFPVQSRDGSIPSYTVPCYKNPFLARPEESWDISIPRDPVPGRKLGPEESPENFNETTRFLVSYIGCQYTPVAVQSDAHSVSVNRYELEAPVSQVCAQSVRVDQ